MSSTQQYRHAACNNVYVHIPHYVTNAIINIIINGRISVLYKRASQSPCVPLVRLKPTPNWQPGYVGAFLGWFGSVWLCFFSFTLRVNTHATPCLLSHFLTQMTITSCKLFGYTVAWFRHWSCHKNAFKHACTHNHTQNRILNRTNVSWWMGGSGLKLYQEQKFTKIVWGFVRN